MDFHHAVDEFLLYLQVEKNYAANTLSGYAYDLKSLEQFLLAHNRPLDVSHNSPFCTEPGLAAQSQR